MVEQRSTVTAALAGRPCRRARPPTVHLAGQRVDGPQHVYLPAGTSAPPSAVELVQLPRSGGPRLPMAAGPAQSPLQMQQRSFLVTVPNGSAGRLVSTMTPSGAPTTFLVPPGTPDGAQIAVSY